MQPTLHEENPDIREIMEEIERVFPGFEEKHDKETVEKFVSLIRSKGDNSTWKHDGRYILIKQGSKYKKVMLSDIVFAETFQRKIVIHTKDYDIDYYGKMSELEEILGEGFFRTHRAYIVNMEHVESFDVESVNLPIGKAIMSKHKYSEFIIEMKRYSEL